MTELFTPEEIADAEPGPRLEYTGPGPFMQNVGDKPLKAGDIVDDAHPYANIRSSLIRRADFREVPNG